MSVEGSNPFARSIFSTNDLQISARNRITALHNKAKAFQDFPNHSTGPHSVARSRAPQSRCRKPPNTTSKIILLGQRLSMRPCEYGRMNTIESFIKAVQILAPDDQIIHQAARRVGEKGLPANPGGAALESVVPMQRMKAPAWPCKARFRSFRSGSHKLVNAQMNEIELEVAIRIKSAEFWLKLGHPDLALLELKGLPGRLKKHPCVLSTHLAVIRASRELGILPEDCCL